VLAVSVWPSRFAGVVRRGQTWLNVSYLLLGFPLGLAYFVTLVVGVSVGIALAVLILGLAILLATLAAWRAMAAIERGLARVLLGVPIPHPPDERRDLAIVDRVTRWLRDPVTWKSLVFVALKFPLGLVSFVAVVALGGFSLVLLFSPVIVLWTPVTVFGWIVTSWTEALPLLVAGVPAFLLVLHLCNGLAWLWALFARVMLGPSTVQLHERVDDLRDARARIIAAGDAERRRIERDLHDGAQQRLVALSITLGMAESRLHDPEAAAPLIAQAREEAALAVKELRELASGIHPALLSERGLGPALEALAARAPVPTTVDGVPEPRMPPPVESAAYFVTAEALTNVAKYAGATTASVSLAIEHGRLLLIIRDDGAGGADPKTGSGLRGLRDRVEALDGDLHIDSPPGLGTTLIAEIPLGGHL
jgi:signal transduction histidine kinase